MEGGAGGDGAATFHREEVRAPRRPGWRGRWPWRSHLPSRRGRRVHPRAVPQPAAVPGRPWRSRRTEAARRAPRARTSRSMYRRARSAFDDETGEPLADLASRERRRSLPGAPRRLGEQALRDQHESGLPTTPSAATPASPCLAARPAPARGRRPPWTAERRQVDTAGRRFARQAKIAEYPFTTLEPMLGVVGVAMSASPLPTCPGSSKAPARDTARLRVPETRAALPRAPPRRRLRSIDP